MPSIQRRLDERIAGFALDLAFGVRAESVTYLVRLAKTRAPPVGGGRDHDLMDRHSAAASKAVQRLAAAWGVDRDSTLELAGLSRVEAANSPSLTEAQSDRVGLLLSIYKALQELYDADLADRWVTLENTNLLCNGRRPIDVMIEEGLPAMNATGRLRVGRVQGPH